MSYRAEEGDMGAGKMKKPKPKYSQTKVQQTFHACAEKIKALSRQEQLMVLALLVVFCGPDE